ncbi:P-loop containing nucleoside triphosphate hydrolase protein [Mycena pura]|uniref:P-loop containing nucleoside triphosphate hydrolase protein n=1 Tax=Mycena pura TaxID=153505 RepID=A0AAD6VSE9_9AGAR|nr:P-loop containing nucleoside triphosphate hydrolase protein [Mycena pura]
MQRKQYFNNCPPASRVFHGRQDILENMQHFFSQDLGKQRIYVLYGLGGVGKTQTALKQIIRLTTLRFSSTCLIDTSTIETIDTGFKAVAVERKIGDTAKDAIQWFTAQKTEWLLFFDNADEPNIDLNNFFPQCKHGNIIITTRNPGLCVYAGANTHVDNMEEEDAAVLLLKTAALEDVSRNTVAATIIVKELAYLPLAIIQAGAFIARSRNLEGFLTIYASNKSRLLSEKPGQSHDSYEWTVYTTWQMSFNKLSPLAARFLQLCSLLHHKGISEDLRFQDVTAEIMAYSLMQFDPDQSVFSMHPLVHDWCQSIVIDQEACHSSIIGILGMCIGCIPEHNLQSMRLVPHVDALLHGGTQMFPDFKDQYALIYYGAGHYTKAEKLWALALQNHREVLGDDHLDTSRSMTRLAVVYRHLGQYEKAKTLLVHGLDKQRQILGDDHPDTLESIHSLALTYCELGQYENALELGLMAVEKKKEIMGEDHPDSMSAMIDLGVVYGHLGRFEEALKLNNLVLEKLRQSLGDDHPHTFTAMNNLSVTYCRLGKFEEAKTLLMSVVEKQMHLLGEDHPGTLISMGNLAITYRALGKFAKAQELHMVVSQKLCQNLGHDHPTTLNSMASMAMTYNYLGQYEDALKLQISVLEKERQILGDGHVQTISSISELGDTYNYLGQFEEALKLNILAVEKRQLILGENHPDTLKSMASLAITYGALGNFEEAKRLQVYVLEKRRTTVGEDDPKTLRTMIHLRAMYYNLGNTEEANKLALPDPEKVIADHNPETQLVISSLAAAYRTAGKVEEAEELAKLFPKSNTFKANE